jgi:FkbM family methyltransferase
MMILSGFFLKNNIYLKRLSFKKFILFTLLNRSKKWFNAPFEVSFSQTGEDLILRFILETYKIKNGFFVDVGCNGPIRYSNTYSLYANGWQGVNIDMDKDMLSAYSIERKHDIIYHAAVSDKEESLDACFYQSSFVNSLDEKHNNYWGKVEPIKRIETIKTQTLTSILNNLNLGDINIDILLVDCEGYDIHVIKSLDFNKYRPKIIIVEMHGFNINNPIENEVYNYLKNENYKLQYYATVNGYFIDGNYNF